MTPPLLEADGVGKFFGHVIALKDISLAVRAGEVLALLGDNGAGKSTLIKCLSGVHRPDEGELRVDGRPVRFGSPRDALAHGIATVYQDLAMIPLLSVAENVALPFLIAGDPVGRHRDRIDELLHLVGLDDKAEHRPDQLSAGEQQRVALARALVHAPRLLLLDEPLGALDALTRIEMHRLIESLWLRHGFTALLVTHDVSEAVALADRVLLIEDHRIALDQRIALTRPRRHGDAAFARHESQLLQRVLNQPA